MPEIDAASQPEYKTACGGAIENPVNYPNDRFQGETIYFCTRACLRVFKEDPQAFMAGKVKHPTEED